MPKCSFPDIFPWNRRGWTQLIATRVSSISTYWSKTMTSFLLAQWKHTKSRRDESNSKTRKHDVTKSSRASPTISWKYLKTFFETCLNYFPIHSSQILRFMVFKGLFCSDDLCLWRFLPGSRRRTLRPGCHHWRRHEEHWRWHWCGEFAGKRPHCRWNQQGLSGRNRPRGSPSGRFTIYLVLILYSWILQTYVLLFSFIIPVIPVPYALAILSHIHTDMCHHFCTVLALTSKSFTFFHTFRPRNL